MLLTEAVFELRRGPLDGLRVRLDCNCLEFVPSESFVRRYGSRRYLRYVRLSDGNFWWDEQYHDTLPKPPWVWVIAAPIVVIIGLIIFIACLTGCKKDKVYIQDDLMPQVDTPVVSSPSKV